MHRRVVPRAQERAREPVAHPLGALRLEELHRRGPRGRRRADDVRFGPRVRAWLRRVAEVDVRDAGFVFNVRAVRRVDAGVHPDVGVAQAEAPRPVGRVRKRQDGGVVLGDAGLVEQHRHHAGPLRVGLHVRPQGRSARHRLDARPGRRVEPQVGVVVQVADDVEAELLQVVPIQRQVRTQSLEHWGVGHVGGLTRGRPGRPGARQARGGRRRDYSSTAALPFRRRDYSSTAGFGEMAHLARPERPWPSAPNTIESMASRRRVDARPRETRQLPSCATSRGRSDP